MALIVSTNGTENWVLSADETLLYVAGDDGNLRTYNVVTGALLNTVDVGFDLGGIALSPDGTKLAITEEVAQNIVETSPWWDNTADALVYVLDLATSQLDTFVFNGTGTEREFVDVAFADDDTLHISQDILPGWSGWATLKTLELGTGEFSSSGNTYYSGLGSAPSLTGSPQDTTVLLGQLGLSSAQYYVIGEDGAALFDNGVYENGVYGYAPGIEAISGSGANGRIALTSGGGTFLYDGNLEFLVDLAQLYPNLANSSGLAFNAAGTRLYAIDNVANTIIGIDTTTFQQISLTQLDNYEHTGLKWGEELVVSEDEKWFYLNTAQGVVQVQSGDLSLIQIIGTDEDDQLTGSGRLDDIISGLGGNDLLVGNAGNDQLVGGAGNDVVYGNAGFDILLGDEGSDTLHGGADADVLIGGAGIDKMIGGAGDDTYFVDHKQDTVVEIANEGTDTVQSTVSFSLANQYVENLALLGNANITATGNFLNNRIFGNSGNNTIDGKSGADEMTGELGNDTYIVDNINDMVYEQFGQGTKDAVISSVSIETLFENVEELTLSGALNLKANGNTLANRLTGNSGNNILRGDLGADKLYGKDGNDILFGDEGNDALDGGAGDDTLYGSEGRDTMTGGGGADRFGFNLLEAGNDNFERIKDFSSADGDKILLYSSAIFTAIGATLDVGELVIGKNALDADDFLIYDSASRKLYYDTDGNGAGAKQLIAVLDGVTTLTVSDFLMM